MTESAGVRLRLYTAEDAPTLERLYPEYVAELVGVGARYRQDAAGVWQPDYLPYWTEPHPSKQVWLFEVGEQVAGFAFVGKKPFPYMSEGADQRLVEFYVAPAFRRSGIGAAAATALFDRLPGRWELSELPDNAQAVAFWRAVLQRYSARDFQETVEGGEPTQRFSSRTRR